MKKIRVEYWELVYAMLLIAIFGFWVGYIVGGSSSWVAKRDVREDLIVNMCVIISSMVILFVLIKNVIYLLRMLNIQKRKKVEGINSTFFTGILICLCVLLFLIK